MARGNGSAGRSQRGGPRRGSGGGASGRPTGGSGAGARDRSRGNQSASRGSDRAPAPGARSPFGPVAQGLGGEQIEGRRAVRELLLADRRKVREVWIAEGIESSDLMEEIEDLCFERRVPVKRVARARLESVARSDVPQGVLAYAGPLPEVDLDDLLCDPAAFLLGFDGVTDPHNLGALVRTGECMGVTGIVLPKNRSVHVTPTVTKASAGAIEHVPIAIAPGMPAALTACKERGVWTVGLDPDGTTDISHLPVADAPIMLVMGAEGAGLSRLTKQRCDLLAGIPQAGAVASLNVSAAGAIACFEVARQRRETGFAP